ncbi:Vegetative incompatibility protein HET-E-1 [Colletotrichum sp. SAR 10_98]|nr:Vegetative incompatibility protein HET-E-1 [Colletotrichum sp. SAR 10_98]
MKERYASFMLTTEPFKYHMSEQLVIADALSATASQFMILSSPSEIPESTKSSGDSESDLSENESDDDSDDEYLSSSTDDNSADETCSEGSTDIDSDQSESEKSESDSEADDQYSESSEEDDEASDVEPENEDDTAKPDESKRTRIVLNYEQPEDNQLKLDEGLLKKKDEIRPTYPGMPGHFRDSKDRITAGVVVYNVSSGQAIRMFRYEHDAPAMLYHSPPALHPTKSLLVWPLGGGEVLFADYEEKTYFTRAAVPTTNDSEFCASDFLYIND